MYKMNAPNSPPTTIIYASHLKHLVTDCLAILIKFGWRIAIARSTQSLIRHLQSSSVLQSCDKNNYISFIPAEIQEHPKNITYTSVAHTIKTHNKKYMYAYMIFLPKQYA